MGAAFISPKEVCPCVQVGIATSSEPQPLPTASSRTFVNFLNPLVIRLSFWAKKRGSRVRHRVSHMWLRWKRGLVEKPLVLKRKRHFFVPKPKVDTKFVISLSQDYWALELKIIGFIIIIMKFTGDGGWRWSSGTVVSSNLKDLFNLLNIIWTRVWIEVLDYDDPSAQ